MQYSGESQAAFWSLAAAKKNSLQRNLDMVQVEVKVKAPQTGAFYGLALRAKGEQFYAFVVVKSQEKTAFLLWSNGAWHELVKWKPVSALNVRSGAVNHLKIVGIGRHFFLYVNGAQVAVYEDGTIPAGQIGLIVGCTEANAPLTVQFDDFSVNIP